MKQKTERYQSAIAELRGTLGSKVSISPSVRAHHGSDEGSHRAASPDAVLQAASTADVVTAVKICARHKMPIIPYGAGTSLEGQIIPTEGGLTVDLSNMNRLLQVNSADMDVRVEAGITRKELNSLLRDQGLFFPVDPGANCTLGGMVATRASGTNAVKYGTMREQLLSLKVVTATGQVIETGTRARKSAAGYDLTHLFCGSEGTLGLITEISLRVHGIPEKIAAGVCRFASLSDAIDTAISTIQLGIPISRVELLDALAIKAVNKYAKENYPEAATLFLEFSGSKGAVTEDIHNFSGLAKSAGGSNIEFAETQEAINQLWHARHQLYYATKALSPNAYTITTDVCVPISRLAECMVETQKDIEKYDLLGSMLGHVGDGNFHSIILVPDNDAETLTRAEEFNARLVRRALDMDGTSTGEHGIGLGKKEFLKWEKENAIPLMQGIKEALDPDGILNPGKIL